jgi:hypothetical protein
MLESDEHKKGVYVAETTLDISKYIGMSKITENLHLISKKDDAPIGLSDNDSIEVQLSASVEAGTPREDGRKTPRGSAAGAAGEQRRVSMLASVPYIPESPSRRTSFKLNAEGDTVFEEATKTEEEIKK